MISKEAGINTVSYNTEDVYKYLKDFYNIEFEHNHSFTTHEIYKIVESSITNKSFGEYLADFLCKTGRCCPVLYSDDHFETYIKYCLNAFADSGIIKSPVIFENKRILTNELLKKLLKNWFNGVMPARESVFLLAFALKMSCEELNNFLMKGICDKGINYKNPAEVAAYICLKEQKDHSYALELLNKAKKKMAIRFPEVKISIPKATNRYWIG